MSFLSRLMQALAYLRLNNASDRRASVDFSALSHFNAAGNEAKFLRSSASSLSRRHGIAADIDLCPGKRRRGARRGRTEIDKLNVLYPPGRARNIQLPEEAAHPPGAVKLAGVSAVNLEAARRTYCATFGSTTPVSCQPLKRKCQRRPMTL